jgi:two-component system, cell cycle sensor histidine kinase and response regulator CckA
MVHRGTCGQEARIYIGGKRTTEFERPLTMPVLLKGPASRATVLVVEDDEMLRSMLVRTLVDQSYRVIAAEHGRAALQLLRSGGGVGLVLTDINMPEMDGFEFARAFRGLHPSVPILFMTGALPEGSAGMSLREVGARLLLKPFGPEVLLEAVETMLSYGPSARRTTA